MKDGNKVLIGLGIGLITGGVAGYFLASEEGQKVQKKTKKQIKKLQADVTQTLKENSELISEKIGTATDSAKLWANEIAETAKAKISSTSNVAGDLVEEAQDDFESGISKARMKMKQKTKAVAEMIENGQV